ncbi:MAG: ABC transporter ATP-binding protein [Betaproteobacteria bacterium]
MNLMADPVAGSDHDGALNRAPGIIAIDNVAKSFALRGGQVCHALRGVTLHIAAGEYVAVLGKSGSGKSTLLNLIAGLDRPGGGDIRVAGTPLNSLGENAMARWRGSNVGVVFQFFQLLPTLTAVENIILAMELVGTVPQAQRRERALNLLQRVGLADQAHKLPSTLSGGQQQRAAIARALANDPPIVLADEPTGNLDTETAADINALFRQLALQGKTLLIVTHDVNLAETAHRIIELKDGMVIADHPRGRAAA